MDTIAVIIYETSYKSFLSNELWLFAKWLRAQGSRHKDCKGSAFRVQRFRVEGSFIPSLYMYGGEPKVLYSLPGPGMGKSIP